MGRKPISNPNRRSQEARSAESGEPGDTGDDRRTIPESSPDLHAPGDPGSPGVGYGRPPLHSRFKPGQSGNPQGRAKRSRNMRTIVQQVLGETMPIREGGRLRRMSAIEALVRTTLTRSFKGDPKALASLIVMMRQCGYGLDRDEPSADLLSAVDCEAILADYRARTFPAGETDSEIDTPNESSTPNSSKKEQ